ncbi:hypothetical protein K3148_11455 [Qipengyuania aurantiaca]|uniref:Uncharacterized protein n=1 Tax=Qipengyuania aurantiaca TaxID=2867233 RepID=A0ABX8ZKC8_9SPHN|nr:hypothetical protein [Qipengyuania aurantiaca]QZD89421.1 hypothetical protein K3148_11455 [Qipengyuania aurantiaca]
MIGMLIVDLSAIDAVAGGEDDAFSFTASGAFTGTVGELVSYVAGGNTFLGGAPTTTVRPTSSSRSKG